MTAKTLLQLAGADLNPPPLSEACLVMIDLQNEYLAGPLALPDAKAATANAAKLLARARQQGAAIFHIAHRGKAGGMFDRTAERGAIISAVAPQGAEAIIEKEMPLPLSKVALFNPASKKGDRIGIKTLTDGKRVRFFKSNGEMLDA